MDAYPVRTTARAGLRRLLKGTLAATTALALSFAGVAVSSVPAAVAAAGAVAGPATVSGTPFSQTTTGAFSGTVPAGVCTVTATVLGAAGGSAVTTTSNTNGAGASITATYPVLPGWTFSGTVGGGGGRPTGSGNSDTAGPGGSNGGGMGGTSGAVSNIKHHGAGGGGYTDLSLNGTLAILAGGGGGAGGGHSTGTDGTGGNAGLPTTSGVANGSPGLKGRDYPNATLVNGGAAGTSTPGAGGTNSQSSAANGFPGVLRVGGAGGNDTNPDAGGGGGGGYAGGGGGASTLTYNTQYAAPAGEQIAGAGGGGGSSYVAPSTTAGNVSGISSVLGPKISTAIQAAGANGSISLTWNACQYDLGVTKSVSPTSLSSGTTATWTVAITNNGPSAMTQGDTVTLTDTLPGAGAKTVTGISVSGGSNTLLQNGAVTCGAVTVGSAMPASLDCSRPYQPVGGSVSGVRGLNVGETLTITYTQPITEPAGSSLTDTVTVTDRPTSSGNNSASATVTVLTPPTAVNDQSLNNALYTPITLSVTGNDTGTFGANAVTLWNTTTSSVITSPYVVANQGTWTVSGNQVTFTPLATFKGDPTPVSYRVTATSGLTATALMTISYVPVAINDVRNNLVIGSPTTLQPLANDDGDWAANTLRLMNAGNPVTSMTVAGQGVWTVSGTDVTFTPQVGFVTDPSPVTYRVTDTTGDNVTATITLNYVPGAADDSSLGNTIGATVDQNVLANDTGSFNAATLVFVANGLTSYTVAGQGTWSIPSSGVVRFTPLAGYKGDPTPVGYRVTDTTGDQVTALVTVAYVPSASNDASLGNVLGTDVTVAVLGNDDGDWAAGSLRIMDGLNPVTVLPVAGQGTWNVVGTSIVFHPESGFLGDPSVIHYRVTDSTGDHATATVTVTYVPEAVSDHRGGLVIGAVATVPVLANDHGDFVTGSLRLVDPVTLNPVTGPVVVAGQGTWTISGTDVVFTPQPGFLLDPTPIDYRITDSTGDTVQATVSLDYRPIAVDDEDLDNALHSVVDLSVLANDTGAFDTATLSLSGSSVLTTLVVVGEGTWTVRSGGVIRFTPLVGFLGDPAPVHYYVQDTLGDAASAWVTVTYVPVAADDSDLDNAFGTDVNIAVTANDEGDWAAGSVRILDGTDPVLTLHVPGQGTWIAEADNTVTFHPDSGFLTDPSPVRYQVTDTTGDSVDARITVTYLPQAVDDAQGGLAIGSVATVPVLDNDHGDWVTSSLRLIDPATSASVTSVTVAGQGTWTISGTNVVFTPLPTFLVDPDPIGYRITDSTDDTVSAEVVLDYGPGAADDEDLGNAIGSVVDVSVFDNDSGVFDASTLSFSASSIVTTLVVPGEGTWTVRPGGIIRFTPLSTFLTDPAPVHYWADDVTGDPADAEVRVTYLPEALDDEDLDNAFGSTVNVDVLGNDTGDFTPGSVRLLDGTLPVTVLPVPGEGTWTVQPDDSITFEPLPTFLVDPTVQHYQVTDSTLDVVGASITITYLPLAVDDARGNIAIGSAVTIPVLSNDHGDFVTSSVRLINPVTHDVAEGSVTVAGQGTWSLGAVGTIVFTPQPGFLVDPDPIDYQVTDTTGDTTGATITLDYVPSAVDDESLGNALGAVIDLDVFGNDHGDFDAATLSLSDSSILTTLTVPGQGTWTVRSGGIVRFTPLGTFYGDPTPIRYYAEDVTGDAADAELTITYLPVAVDDTDLGNVMGDDVNVAVLSNDTGDFTSGTVRLVDGASLLMNWHVDGQGTWRVESDDTITFDPDAGFLTDPTPVRYQVTDSTDDVVGALVTITYLPEADDDTDLGNVLGTAVNANVLGNDTGEFVADTVRVIDPATHLPVVTLVVVGEGTWHANADGTITFTPENTFLVDPAPVDYQVTDTTGDTVSAQLTVTYVPTTVNDRKDGNVLHTTVDVDPLANDTGDFILASVRLIDPATHLPVTSLSVAGQGMWVVDTATGHVTFTPLPAFVSNPTTQTYRVTDTTGDDAEATITVSYLPTAINDRSLGNRRGAPVSVSILGNDAGALDVSTARLVNGSGTPMMDIMVPGQGTWHMNATTGVVTFTPEPGFTGDPTPMPYRVLDVNGNEATADITITYLHPTAVELALTGMSSQTPLMIALAAIILGLGAMIVGRSRRITARHRA